MKNNNFDSINNVAVNNNSINNGGVIMMNVTIKTTFAKTIKLGGWTFSVNHEKKGEAANEQC